MNKLEQLKQYTTVVADIRAKAPGGSRTDTLKSEDPVGGVFFR